jgi:hypothetical protein
LCVLHSYFMFRSYHFECRTEIRLYLLSTSRQIRSWGSSVSVVSHYTLDERCSIRGKGKGFFPLASVSRPAIRPTQTPIQWVPGGRFLGVKRSLYVTLTTHPHLVPRSRMNRRYISSPIGVFMAAAGQFYFTPRQIPLQYLPFGHDSFLPYPLQFTLLESSFDAS